MKETVEKKTVSLLTEFIITIPKSVTDKISFVRESISVANEIIGMSELECDLQIEEYVDLKLELKQWEEPETYSFWQEVIVSIIKGKDEIDQISESVSVANSIIGMSELACNLSLEDWVDPNSEVREWE